VTAGPGSAERSPQTAGAGAAGAPRPQSRPDHPVPDPADLLPVARVAVDVPLPHLDRLFDYQVPESMAASASPGCRVRVRFAGRLTSGFIIERVTASLHAGRLAYLSRLVSPEPVLTPEIAGLARAVADRYGGTLADVLRLAVPPRHARAEAEQALAGDPSRAPGVDGGQPGPDQAGWPSYPAGPSFLAALAEGRSPRAVWTALPGAGAPPAKAVRPGPHDPADLAWPAEIAAACAATVASGRGALVVVPDASDLAMVDAALAVALGPGGHVTLSAQAGPERRYRSWLAVRRGQVRVAAGTRSAVFAPVADLGLAVIWDDGDDLHAEPRAPYPHARDVLVLRAHRTGAGLLIGGYARTAEAAHLVATGWARPLAADRAMVRERVPLVLTAGQETELARDQAATTARMPVAVLRAAREALVAGPVLFQVPRRGYLAAVACRRCGARIRCGACSGPVALAGRGQDPRCGWCGSAAPRTCPACGCAGLRALITGVDRTAEELARAFPGVPVRTSRGAGVLSSVPGSPAIVIATPGAEPRAGGGYAAAVLLDGWALLGRPSLRAAEEALRRWLNAAALVRARPAGGKVLVLAEPALAVVQALVRWDPAGHADRELAERSELGFPPAVRMAAVTGPDRLVGELLTAVRLPDQADVLGPVEVRGDPTAAAAEAVRYLIRVPSGEGTALAVALRAGLAERSARKDQGTVRVQLDPVELI
jgi:primosomal protein N' (replication factor Y)